jgi:hypothetical protein
MALTERSLVVGVFADRSQAEQSIEQLRRAGFGDDEVGFAMRGEEPAEEGTHPGTSQAMDLGGETGTQAKQEFTGALTGTAAGGVLGAAAALLIPGLGPVTLAGVMAGLLAGAGAGAAAGGIVGALTGLGASEEEARYYQQELEAGRALVVVKTDGRSEEAATVLVNQGAYGLAGQRELRM